MKVARIYKQILRSVLFILMFNTHQTFVLGKVEVLDGSNGLSSSIVNAIIRDRQGLMWIGTQNGLNIYAGYNFTRPYPELGNQPITHLAYDDEHDMIWVGTYNGLYSVQADKGTIRYIGPEDEANYSRVTALLYIPKSGVFVAYQNGVIASVDKFYNSRILFRSRKNDAVCMSLVKGPDSTVLFCSPDRDGTIARLQIKTGRIDKVPRSGKDSIYTLERSGRFLIGKANRGSVRIYDAETYLNITPDFLRNSKCELIGSYDEYLVVAIGSSAQMSDTVVQINIQTGAISDLGKRNSDIFIGRQKYYCVFRDTEQIIWIGTNRGIYKVTPERELFELLLNNGRPRVTTRTIIEDVNGDIYTGSNFGLYHFDAGKAKWTRYEYLRHNDDESRALVNAILDDSDYVYVTGYHKTFFARFDKRKKVFETNFYQKLDKQTTFNGHSLMRDREGLIWIGSRNGLFTYDPAQNKLSRHLDDTLGIGDHMVQGLTAGSDPHIVWICTDRGLFQLHKQKGVLSHFHIGSSPALSTDHVYSVFEDSIGRLWLGTNGGGINIISSDRKRVEVLDKEQNGLSDDIVYGILHHNGKYWASTYHGLSCYDSRKRTFYNYYVNDGLCENEFNYNSYLKSENGKMYFGGINGISAFHPDSMNTVQEHPVSLFMLPVSKWDTKTKSFKNINDLKEQHDKIVLNSPNASLVLNLGLTDYADPMHNNFSYRILGLFDEWMSLSGNPVLRLHGIPYGNYTVEIKATNARGTPATNTLRFFLHIERPFYTTWWFYTLMLMLSAGLISAFFYIKYRNLKTMQRLRLHIASHLHDEVGSLLTSITMFSDNLRFSGSTGVEKDSRLEKIAGLSREATITMSDILWAVDVRKDVLDSLSERMREYAEELFLPLNIALTVEIPPMQPRAKITAELRQELYLIFKESVNNILKHSSATYVRLIFSYDHIHAFHFQITNDGVHNAASRRHGQGLKNIAMRAHKIGASVDHRLSDDIFMLTVWKGAYPMKM